MPDTNDALANKMARHAILIVVGLTTFAAPALSKTPQPQPSQPPTGTASATLASNRTATTPTACGLEPGPALPIKKVIDAETVQLVDGRELYLGVLTASLADEAAIAFLEKHTTGRTLTIFQPASKTAATDRYGRLLGQAVVNTANTNTAPEWLQAVIIENGLARVSPALAPSPCNKTLLAIEERARNEKRGYWGGTGFQILDASNPSNIAQSEGRFAIVSGTVRRSSQSKGRTYLNFGREWKNDFTVLIPRRIQPAKTSQKPNLDPPDNQSKLLVRIPIKAQRIRVRGWVEMRGGPMIQIDDPDQIEILDLN